MGYGPHSGPNLKRAIYPCSFYDVTPAYASSHVMLVLKPITFIHSLAPTPVSPLLSDCTPYDSYGPHMGPKIRWGITQKCAPDPCSFLRPLFLGCFFCTPLYFEFWAPGLSPWAGHGCHITTYEHCWITASDLVPANTTINMWGFREMFYVKKDPHAHAL